ncbi:alpha/beta fold hydrolase [uncultured Bacteroides sp.]|uniref:alpha/beta fold hydrolase n=1 Tax=uncultured Bacteroides sp. TaxID=162156 RepID=UPI002AA5EF27|nr:alpha/beta fold hydrolase [uncultured Bacteroides sp.]
MKIKLILMPIIMTIIPMTIKANNMIKYNYQQIENVKVFYREAGNPDKPTILLLHGFPSSSVMFRQLMPELADEYHLIAPDMPGFGQTEAPDKPNFEYSFYNLARTIDKFTEAIGLTQFR